MYYFSCLFQMSITKRQSNTRNFNIILDLDNTVISSIEMEKSKPSKKSDKFNSHVMEDYYVIYHRPYLQEFLDYIFSNMNVAVWTSATPDYAEFIIKNILTPKGSKRKLDFVLTSAASDYSEEKCGNQKCLDLIWNKFGAIGYRPDNTILLDNLDEIRNGQTCHVLPAVDFEYNSRGSEKDKFLLRLIKLLESKKHDLRDPENACPARRILGRKNKI